MFLVTRGEGEVHASLIIATALGIGLTVLLAALMTLIFLSAESGHDDEAAPKARREDEE